MKVTPHDRLGVRVSRDHGLTIRKIANQMEVSLTAIIEHAIDLVAAEHQRKEVRRRGKHG